MSQYYLKANHASLYSEFQYLATEFLSNESLLSQATSRRTVDWNMLLVVLSIWVISHDYPIAHHPTQYNEIPGHSVRNDLLLSYTHHHAQYNEIPGHSVSSGPKLVYTHHALLYNEMPDYSQRHHAALYNN